MSETEKFSGQLYVVSAPSGAGKTSLVKALVDGNDALIVSVSHTTRAKRPGEVNGINYHFVSVAEFNDLKSEAFSSGHRCSITFTAPVSRVYRAAESRHDVFLEIDWQGAAQVKQQIPDAVAIFILPPSTAALRERLTGRGQDDERVIERRMQSARDEISHYGEADYVVLNDRFETALNELQAIITSQRLTQRHQSSRLTSVISDLLG